MQRNETKFGLIEPKSQTMAQKETAKARKLSLMCDIGLGNQWIAQSNLQTVCNWIQFRFRDRRYAQAANALVTVIQRTYNEECDFDDIVDELNEAQEGVILAEKEILDIDPVLMAMVVNETKYFLLNFGQIQKINPKSQFQKP